MKTINIIAALLFSIFFTQISIAQSVIKENIKVSGNCSLCKKTIETAAKSVGASDASWNSDTKILAVSYDPSTLNSSKIQHAVSAAGYETQHFKGDEKAYNKLMTCCKYKKNTAFTNSKNSNINCKKMDCCKDKKCCDENGKCNSNSCKSMAECSTMECCKS